MSDRIDWEEPKKDIEVVDDVSHKMPKPNWRNATDVKQIIALFPKNRPKFDEVAELAQRWQQLGKPPELRMFLDKVSQVAESRVSPLVRRLVT